MHTRAIMIHASRLIRRWEPGLQFAISFAYLSQPNSLSGLKGYANVHTHCRVRGLLTFSRDVMLLGQTKSACSS